MRIDERIQLQRAVTRKVFKDEYMAELDPLARATMRKDFDGFLKALTGYPEHLDSVVSRRDPYALLERASQGGVIQVASAAREIKNAFVLAQMAACCHLLHGSILARQDLNYRRLKALAESFIASCEQKTDEYVERVVGKFHTMDVMRVMLVLRILGLVERPSEDMLQIGLAAANGTRDVLSVHLLPSVSMGISAAGETVNIGTDSRRAVKTIIMDTDPAYAEQYEALNNDPGVNVEAYLGDAVETLNRLPEQTSDRFNLVTALRIDHRMIPEPRRFLLNLSRCIDDDCDFILSIGAGDSLADFKGRIDTVWALFELLKTVGMRPVLFKLHGTGDLKRQWKSLLYGNARASSYQFLYCRLSGPALEDALKD